MEKRKEKPKTKRWGKPSFDFVSSYPLDLCVHLLQSQNGQEQYYPLSLRFLPPTNELKVEIRPIDEDSCSFRIRWKEKKRPGNFLFSTTYATANGYLKRWDNKSTHIVGRVQLARWLAIWSLVSWFIVMGFFVAFFYPSTRDNIVLCLPPVWTAILVINLYQLIRIRQKLSHILEDVLQPIHETNVKSIALKHD